MRACDDDAEFPSRALLTKVRRACEYVPDEEGACYQDPPPRRKQHHRVDREKLLRELFGHLRVLSYEDEEED